ncbi:MAG: LysR substrate-binding domain-containing protein [Thiolinea sp.]
MSSLSPAKKVPGTRGAIERHLRQFDLKMQASLEMRSNETIKHAVEAGLGLGIVSLHTIQPELDSQRLVVLDVESFPLQRHWHMVMRKGKRLSPVALAFREFVKAQAPRSSICCVSRVPRCLRTATSKAAGSG